MTILTAVDHLVVGSSSLETGCEWMENLLGVPSVAGGAHPLMGTHNALWNLGDSYVEVIATDPNAKAPDRPRCFGLDEPLVQGKLSERPRLLTWVLRVDDIHVARTALSIDPGRPLRMSRDELYWDLTVPDDGALVLGGAMPV